MVGELNKEVGAVKRKSDFITNSSSASFIMTFTPVDGTIDLDDFTLLFNHYIETYKKRFPNSLRYWDASNINQVPGTRGSNLFSVKEFTSMYNDESDVPEYMKDLMINSYIRDPNWGFKVESFVVDD